jgi:ribulose-bisphosphate carboxylase small chain
MMTNPTGRITQGQFSFLPDLTDAEITLQIEYGLAKGWAWSVEYTDDPHPRNTYWEMYGMPMFDLKDAAGVLMELHDCRKAFPQHYIRLMAFDSTRGGRRSRMSFIVNRPKVEPASAWCAGRRGRAPLHVTATPPTVKASGTEAMTDADAHSTARAREPSISSRISTPPASAPCWKSSIAS